MSAWARRLSSRLLATAGPLVATIVADIGSWGVPGGAVSENGRLCRGIGTGDRRPPSDGFSARL